MKCSQRLDAVFDDLTSDAASVFDHATSAVGSAVSAASSAVSSDRAEETGKPS